MQVTLYGKDTKGNIKEWRIETEGKEIHVYHGRLGGKHQKKTTVCEAKNVGRANETSAEEQAILEAEAKVRKQRDKLYKDSPDNLDSIGEELPMLAQDYTKTGHRMVWPCSVGPKLDGLRCLALIKQGSVVLKSRGGKEYPCPLHLYVDLQKLLGQRDELLLDGELYIHGVSLQNIVSAAKKHNDMTPRLQYWIFDVPHATKTWQEREVDLMDIMDWCQDHLPESLRVVNNYIVMNEEEAYVWLGRFVQLGYEGLMLRDPQGLYVFNHRSPGLMKWKEFVDAEAKVISVKKDKLGEGVLLCRLPDGIEFECKMRGSHAYRIFDVQMGLVGGWINFRYQQLTDGGVPQFPVGICVRECDEEGKPVE